MIKVKLLSGWDYALSAARKTVNKGESGKEPSRKWRLKMLYAEHSPIRLVRYWVDLIGIKRWVSVHLVRHKFGVEHFVGTQRTDRTGIDRDKLPQDEPTDHSMELNAQAFINISRKRLCRKASKETREAWSGVVDELSKVDPELASVCVPDCVYRGKCFELQPCGWSESKLGLARREKYIKM